MTKTDSNPILIAKRAAGQAAAEFIQGGMIVGLGTGSTAAFFIEALGKRCQMGLKISAVATSEQSARQAQRLGIPMQNHPLVTSLDITVDGADEIDPHKNMIKGGGGALLREKILAQASKKLLIIVDETKLVNQLGDHPLPIEIAPFLYQNTIQRLQEQGYSGVLRLDRENQPFITDNGNYIFDIQFPNFILEPHREHERLKNLTGVIETGLFFLPIHQVIVGYEDGFTKVLS